MANIKREELSGNFLEAFDKIVKLKNSDDAKQREAGLKGEKTLEKLLESKKGQAVKKVVKPKAKATPKKAKATPKKAKATPKKAKATPKKAKATPKKAKATPKKVSVTETNPKGLPFATRVKQRADKDGITFKEARVKLSKEIQDEKDKIEAKLKEDKKKALKELEKITKAPEFQQALSQFPKKSSGKKRALKSNVSADGKRQALPRGKRISQGKGANQYGKAKKGKVYYEYRDNRSDVNSVPTKAGQYKYKGQAPPYLEAGGEVDDIFEFTLTPKTSTKSKGQAQENSKSLVKGVDNNSKLENVIHYATAEDTKRADPSSIQSIRVRVFASKKDEDKIDTLAYLYGFKVSSSRKATMKGNKFVYAEGGTLPTPFGQAGLVGETGTMNEVDLFAMGGGLPQGVHQYYAQTYNPAYPTPHGYAKGGMTDFDSSFAYKGTVVGFKEDGTGRAFKLGEIKIPKYSTSNSIISLAKSKFKRVWYIEVARKDGKYIYEISDDGKTPTVTTYAKGGQLEKNNDILREIKEYVYYEDFLENADAVRDFDDLLEGYNDWNYDELNQQSEIIIAKHFEGVAYDEMLQNVSMIIDKHYDMYAKGGMTDVMEIEGKKYRVKTKNKINEDGVNTPIDVYEEVEYAKGGALNSLKKQMNDDLDIHSEYYAKGGTILKSRNKRKGDIGNRDKKVKVDTVYGDRAMRVIFYDTKGSFDKEEIVSYETGLSEINRDIRDGGFFNDYSRNNKTNYVFYRNDNKTLDERKVAYMETEMYAKGGKVNSGYYVEWFEDMQRNVEEFDANELDEAKYFYNFIKSEKFYYEKPKVVLTSIDNDEVIMGKKFAKGGMIEIDEDGSNIPSKLQEVFDQFNEDEDSYKEMERLRLKAQEVGYDFDYDLSGQPTEFMEINKMAKGGFLSFKSTKEADKYIQSLSEKEFKKLGDFALVYNGKEYQIRKDIKPVDYAKGGRTISIVNDGVKYDKSKYKAVYGDYDKDGVVNIDDANPLNKNKKGKVEEIELKNTFDKLLGVKAELDEIMYDAVDTLDEKAPKGADIYARTKTPYSILKKLVEKRMLDPKRGLTDMIGTTIAVENQKELVELRDKIDNGLLGKVLDRDDFYKRPNAGYRAYHYIVEYKGVPVEVQLKTKNMKKLHEVAHKSYKLGTLNPKTLNEVSIVFMKADKGDAKSKVQMEKLLSNKKQLISKISK